MSQVFHGYAQVLHDRMAVLKCQQIEVYGTYTNKFHFYSKIIIHFRNYNENIRK